MRRNRRLAATLAGTAALALATAPVVVVADSVTGELIRGLNSRLLYIAVPIAVLVEVILFYAVWRFRDNDEPEPTRENRELEITWTVATGLVLLFVGTASYAVLAHPYVASDAGSGHGHGHSHAVQPGNAPPEAVEVVVVAEQWDYSFRYPAANATSEDELVLPTGQPVHIYVTSDDVLHSFHVPELGLKQDIFPGQYNLLRTRLVDEGEHRLYCAQFCGNGHAGMVESVRVVGPAEFDAWLADQGNATRGSAGTQANDSAVAGRP